jgi:hypothetical protein
MADVITRFKLETTQFDSKLRDTAKALKDIAATAQSAGSGFNGFTQKSIEAARALGTVASGATNTKDKLRDLVGSYNDAVKAYDLLSDEAKKGEFGQAMAASLQKLQQDIKNTKEELYGLGDSVKSSTGVFDGLSGAMSVFAGNMLTTAVTSLASEIGDTIKQSIELAKAGEGVRMAFDRLNRPDLLDKLREATHGTVSDLDLMKQAVKFDNFKLPLEDLATYLAFAQQKAKDTGESVDYMVDSITTGLGRQSKQILDNLGISAAELTKRMGEGKDMTQAVAEIIRDEMAKAGDYVETAADRAAQATARAQNKAEEFGRSAMPVAQEWAETWATLSQGAMSFANTLLGPVARSLQSIQNILNSGPDVDDYKNSLIEAAIAKAEAEKRKSASTGYQGMGNRQRVVAPGGYVEVTDSNTGAVIGGRHFDNLNDKNSINDWRKSVNKTSSTKSSGKSIKEDKDDFEEIIGLIPNAEEAVKSLQEQIKMSWDEGEIESLTKDLQAAERELQRLKNIGKDTPLVQGLSGFNQQTMQAWMRGRQSDLSKAEYGSADYSSIMGNIADMNSIKTILEQSLKAGIDAAQFDLEPLWEKVFDGENIPDSTWESMVDVINEKLKEMKLDPIKLDFNTGGLSTEGKKAEKSWQSAAVAVASVGSAIQSIEDPAAKVVGTVAQAIATVALSFSQALAKTSGPWEWIAFAATGLATMITTISAIHSATGYANGGIVGGNSYSGDNISAGPDAMVNSGELILNKAQQNVVAQDLQEGNRMVQVHGVLRGKDIFIAAENWSKSVGKGELVTW